VLLAAGVPALAEFEFSGGGGGQRVQLYNRGPYASDDVGLSGRAGGSYTVRAGKFKLRPRVQASVIYDDNVYLEVDEPVSATYSVLSPSVMLLFGNEQHNYCYVDYSIDIPVLAEELREDIRSQSATAFVRYERPKSQVNAWHRYRDIRGMDTVLGARISKQEHVSFGGIEHRVGSKTSLGLNGTYEIHDFEDMSYTDFMQYEVAGRMYWHARARTDFFGQLGHGWVDIDGQEQEFGDARYAEASVGVRGRLRPKLSAVGRVGYQHRYFDSEEINDIDHWTSAIDFDGRLFRHVRAGLGLWTSIRPAVNAAGHSVIETRIEPGLSRRLWSDRLIGSVNFALGRVDYRGPADVEPDPSEDVEEEEPVVYDGRLDYYAGFTALLDWWWTRYSSVGVGYSRMESRSNREGDFEDEVIEGDPSYTGERWLLRASFNF